MLGGVLVVANAGVCRGVVLGQLRGVSGIHMSEDYFGQGVVLN